MARFVSASVATAFLLIYVAAFAQEILVKVPSPSPAADAVDSPPAPPPAFGSPSPSPGPADSQLTASPPAPSKLSPSPATDTRIPSAEPSNSADMSPPSPVLAPRPSDASDMNHSDITVQEGEKSGSGMSGGKKVGIAVGVLAAVAVVVVGGSIYKKRQDNIRRSQYSQAARSLL